MLDILSQTMFPGTKHAGFAKQQNLSFLPPARASLDYREKAGFSLTQGDVPLGQTCRQFESEIISRHRLFLKQGGGSWLSSL